VGRHAARGSVELAVDACHQLGGTGRFAERLADAEQHALEVGMGARIEHLHGYAQGRQPLPCPAAWTEQHHVGPQGHDAFDLRILQAADLGQLGDRAGPAGVAVGTDQLGAVAEGADGLGERGGQGDDAVLLLLSVRHGCCKTAQQAEHRQCRHGGVQQAGAGHGQGYRHGCVHGVRHQIG
jgi:hypothetical protein